MSWAEMGFTEEQARRIEALFGRFWKVQARPDGSMMQWAVGYSFSSDTKDAVMFSSVPTLDEAIEAAERECRNSSAYINARPYLLELAMTDEEIAKELAKRKTRVMIEQFDSASLLIARHFSRCESLLEDIRQRMPESTIELTIDENLDLIAEDALEGKWTKKTVALFAEAVDSVFIGAGSGFLEEWAKDRVASSRESGLDEEMKVRDRAVAKAIRDFRAALDRIPQISRNSSTK